jgi:hypothetical protein
MVSHSPWYWPFNFFSALYPTTQIKTKFFIYLCLENGSCTLLLVICYVCLFWEYCSFKGVQWGFIYLNINPRCSNYFALLPTMPIIFQRCCPQRRKLIGVVAYNADNFSTLLPTTRKSTVISVHMCFSALLPTTAIIFLRCGPQRGKMIGVVAYIAEKLSALLPTTRKNVLTLISQRIGNHVRIYTRISVRCLGWCFSWRKVEVKNLVGLSL